MTAYEELKAELKQIRQDVDALMGDKTLSDDFDPFDDETDEAWSRRCLALEDEIKKLRDELWKQTWGPRDVTAMDLAKSRGAEIAKLIKERGRLKDRCVELIDERDAARQVLDTVTIERDDARADVINWHEEYDRLRQEYTDEERRLKDRCVELAAGKDDLRKKMEKQEAAIMDLETRNSTQRMTINDLRRRMGDE